MPLPGDFCSGGAAPKKLLPRKRRRAGACSRRRKLVRFPDFAKENKPIIACGDVVLHRKTTGGSKPPPYRRIARFPL